MNLEAFHKFLESMVDKYPVHMSMFIQKFGPIPDGDNDNQRQRFSSLLEKVLSQ